MAMVIGFLVIAVIVAIAVAQRSGPRITHIETHREDRSKDGD